MFLEKPKTYRSEKYLAFVRSQPCCICRNPETEAHHVEKAGTSKKGSDLSCVPLCRPCHSLVHHMGRHTFEAKHAVDLLRVNMEVLRLYVASLEGEE